jgi:long-chain acyl-CoA synthetase
MNVLQHATTTRLALPYTSLTAMLAPLIESPQGEQRLKHPLFITKEGEVTRHTFVEQVLHLREALLQGWKLQAGQRVALMFWNQSEFFVAFFALRSLGVVPVPINILMPPQDVGYVLKHAEISGVLATEELALQISQGMGVDPSQLPFPVFLANQQKTAGALPSFEAACAGNEPLTQEALSQRLNEVTATILNEANLDDTALLMYTSGTTGNPKGVMLSERNLLSNLAGFADRIHLTHHEERALIGLPLFHAYGLICGLYALSLQATIVLAPKFNPKSILELIETQHVTFLPLVPTMFTVLLQAAKWSIQAGHDGKPFPSLRVCISGGAALPERLLNAVQENLGVTLLEGYGLTETSPVLAVNSSEEGAVFGAVGRPLANIELRLCDYETQAILPITPGVASGEGEIQVRGENVMLGYYKDEEATQAVLDAEGWFKTGDLGHVDARGMLRISGGRLKDLIIRAGENIAPLPIERVLAQHSAVANVAVIPKKDDRLGEGICACIEVEPTHWENGIDEAQLKRELSSLTRQQLSASYSPDFYYFTPSLPKSPTGKILKKHIQVS